MSPTLRGVLYMIISATCFAGMGLQVRLLSPGISATESLFIRGLLNSLAIIPLIAIKRQSFFGTHHKELLFRGVIGSLAAIGYFWAIALGPMAEVIGLYRSAALFMPFIAVFVLHERPQASRFFYALLGFCGACLILKPGYQFIGPGPWIAIFGALLNAFAWATVRSLTKKESALTIMLYFSVCSAITSALSHGSTFIVPNQSQALMLVTMSLCGLVGQFFLTRSYAYVEASLLTPVGYSEVVSMAIFGWCFFGEVPDLSSILGMTVILAAVLLITRSERSPITAPNILHAVPTRT